LKIEVGGYNPLLGKSYGEIGGEARSMHKSQGEGRPRRRGAIVEYFTTTGGDTAKYSLMDGIDTTWSRVQGGAAIQRIVDGIVSRYNFSNPSASVPALITVYKTIKALPASQWRSQKLLEIQQVIEAASALFVEVNSTQQFVVQGDTLRVNFAMNNRSTLPVIARSVKLNGFDTAFNTSLATNQNLVVPKIFAIPEDKKISQPYWLERPLHEGSFDVQDQEQIGKAESNPVYEASFELNISGEDFTIKRPVLYKVVDPAKGELYQPLVVLPKLELSYAKDNYVSMNGKPINASLRIKSNVANNQRYLVNQHHPATWYNNRPTITHTAVSTSDSIKTAVFSSKTSTFNTTDATALMSTDGRYDGYTKVIAYDHIPTITYFPKAKANLVKADVKTAGKKAGYIAGAGDKLPEALIELGYQVTTLSEKDITTENLQQFDAIVVGIRAHNIYEYLTNKNEVLNQYVYNGGNLVVQYVKSNVVGNKRIAIGPYPFSISAGLRVTEEDAPVTFINPSHPVFNYPNKITEKDFEGWVQERSTYQLDQSDAQIERLIQMNDKNDKPSNGSLGIAKYGKGNIAYVSLVLFRQLPAGVPGAYRLLANLVALPQNNMATKYK